MDGAVVVNAEGVIQDVGLKAEMTAKYPSEEVKDYGDVTLLPGLCDMHVHFGYYYSQPDQGAFDDFMIAYYAQEQAKLALSLGLRRSGICLLPIICASSFSLPEKRDG